MDYKNFDCDINIGIFKKILKSKKINKTLKILYII